MSETSKQSAQWVRENLDKMKLVNDSEPISEKIARWKKNDNAVRFSIPKEEFGVMEEKL